MSGSGLAIIGLLILVLGAVALGAQQMDNQKTALIEDLKAQRQALIDSTGQALQQRDGAVARAEELAKQNGELAQALAEKESKIASQEAVIARLMETVERQDAEIALLKPVPVSGPQVAAGASNGEKNPKYVVASNSAAETCLVSQSGVENRLASILVFLMGVVVLGGGYADYRTNPGRSYTVRMTREQLKQYIRYQRERGSRIA